MKFGRTGFKPLREANAAVLAEQEAESEWYWIRLKWVATGFVCGTLFGVLVVLYWLSTLLVVEPTPASAQPPVQERKLT